MIIRPIHLLVFPILASLTLLTNCGSSEPTKSGANGQAASNSGKVKAGGATLPSAAYADWPSIIKKEEPGLAATYEPSNSAEGIQQFLAGQLDVAATEMPASEAQIASLPTKPVHLPILISGIVPIYNVSAIKGDLKHSADALAKIFAGKIKSWNDPAIAKTNDGLELPAAPITVIRRADPSGTTFVLTHYLSKVSPDFQKSIGEGMEVKWPNDKGAKGSAAMADLVKATPNAIGYVDLNFAQKAGLSVALVENADGKFVKATLETIGAAADAVTTIPDDFRMDLNNAPGPRAYPIATYTYLLVPTQIEDLDRRSTIRRYLQWVTQSGQKLAMSLDYGILPPPVLRKVEARVDRIR